MEHFEKRQLDPEKVREAAQKLWEMPLGEWPLPGETLMKGDDEFMKTQEAVNDVMNLLGPDMVRVLRKAVESYEDPSR